MDSKETNAMVTVDGTQERLLSVTNKLLQAKLSSSSTSVIHQLLQIGHRMPQLASRRPALLNVTTAAFGPLVKNSFQTVLSSALLDPSALKLKTSSNVVLMEMTPTLAKLTHSAR